MKVYVLIRYYEENVSGVYLSPEAAMSSNPPPEPNDDLQRHGGWIEERATNFGMRGRRWSNGFAGRDYARIDEWEVSE